MRARKTAQLKHTILGAFVNERGKCNASVSVTQLTSVERPSVEGMHRCGYLACSTSLQKGWDCPRSEGAQVCRHCLIRDR